MKIRTSRAGRRRGERGFTLLELLVVLVIIGLTVSLIPGFLLRDNPSAILDRAAASVADGLRSVRSRAVLENRENLFAIDVESHQFRAGAEAIPVQIGSDIALRLLTAESERSGETSGRIRFYPDGSSTGGRILLASGADRREVEVDWLTGDILVRDDAR
ncbi:MAG: GspH/FimT family pseudopilin [Alphaproteobacteria bacterium]